MRTREDFALLTVAEIAYCGAIAPDTNSVSTAHAIAKRWKYAEFHRKEKAESLRLSPFTMP